MNCEQANQLDLVEFLDKLGYQPQKVKSNDYWYLSPLRNEYDPSFKVNNQKNCWYDHGLGAGGKLVDFSVRYFNCQITEALQKISSFQQQKKVQLAARNEPLVNSHTALESTQESVLKILDSKNPIVDIRLRPYLDCVFIYVKTINRYLMKRLFFRIKFVRTH